MLCITGKLPVFILSIEPGYYGDHIGGTTATFRPRSSRRSLGTFYLRSDPLVTHFPGI